MLFGFPAFVVLLMAGDLFFEGGLANLAPYSVEVFGVRLGARSVGLAQAANAIGKMAGPIILALIAGTSNFVLPQATADSILPAFVFFAICSLVLGLCFTLLTANANALVQRDVPDRLRGRVVGLYLFAFAGLAPVGGLVAGWLVDIGGTMLAFGVAGATGIAIAAYVVGDRERVRAALGHSG